MPASRSPLALLLAAVVLPGCTATLRPVESVPNRTEAREVGQAQPAQPVPAKPAPVPSSAPAAATGAGGAAPDDVVAEEPDMPEGIFHRVEAGQTLWRIARAYGVNLQALAEVNHLADPRTVETGRLLFVPGAALQIEVAPYPAPPPAGGDSVRPLAALPTPSGAEPGEYVWPVRGGEILSLFGVPRLHHRHAGVDIRGSSGQDVLAAAGGEVVFSGASLGGYGKLVILDHGDQVQTLYAHNSKLVVHVGDIVVKGQVVARVGRTGNATTEHCHFEVRKDKVPVNPLSYYPDRALTASRQLPAATPVKRASAGSSRRQAVTASETADR